MNLWDHKILTIKGGCLIQWLLIQIWLYYCGKSRMLLSCPYPFINCAAVKYAAIAWSCSFPVANECPNASQAGPYVLSSVVALLKTENSLLTHCSLNNWHHVASGIPWHKENIESYIEPGGEGGSRIAVLQMYNHNNLNCCQLWTKTLLSSHLHFTDINSARGRHLCCITLLFISSMTKVTHDRQK